MHTDSMSSIQLSRMLQLASSGLPIGGYSYSQAFEWVIDSGEISDQQTAQSWIEEVMLVFYGDFELPILKRIYQAWLTEDAAQIDYWDSRYKAGRDSVEAQLESRQMGYSLLRLQNDLATFNPKQTQIMNQLKEPSYPCVFAATTSCLNIPLAEALHIYVWSWLENQVNVAMKTIPLGQVSGQKILTKVSALIPSVVTQAMDCGDDEISSFCPRLSIAGCQHETQYSRLFRS